MAAFAPRAAGLVRILLAHTPTSLASALPLRTAFSALLAFGALCTAFLAGRGALALVSLDAFLPLARLRFGFGGQGSDRHRRGEGAQRAAF